MSIRWLKRAVREANIIHNYIALDKPKAATDFLAQLEKDVDLLHTLPSLGHPGRVRGTREKLVTNTKSYIIVYRIVGEDIEILSLMHTSRTWPQGFND